MLLRFVLLAVLLVLLVRFLTRLAAAVLVALDEGGTVARRQEAPGEASIPLARCGRCGAYVPQPTLRGSGDHALCRRCAAA